MKDEKIPRIINKYSQKCKLEFKKTDLKLANFLASKPPWHLVLAALIYILIKNQPIKLVPLFFMEMKEDKYRNDVILKFQIQ